MQAFKILLTIAVALFVQLLLGKYLKFFKYIDLALLVTVYFSLQREPLLGMIVGMGAGLGADIIAGGILGVAGFSKTLIGYIISMASVKLSIENPLGRLAAVALASLANTALFIGLYRMLEQNQIPDQVAPLAGSWSQLLKTAGWKALADTLAAVIVFITLDRVFYEHATARRMAIKRRFYE